jgi:hypothetical protein
MTRGTEVGELVAFVTARLDEDEAVATAAGRMPWDTAVGGAIFVATALARYVASVEREADRQHIARHDPARVLADIAAKRRLVRSAQILLEDEGTGPSAYCLALEILDAVARPHADHEDYRPEWRP